MKKVKVHSNSIRNKLFVVGDGLVLNFDENGDAFCFESDLPQIKAYSRVRPGRFVVVEEPKKKAAPAPAPKKVEKKAAKKSESKSKDEPEDKTRRAPKKAPKKSFFKKSEE